MNIYIHELRSNFKGLIIWTFGVLLFIVAGMQKYEALIEGTGEELTKLLNSLPEILKTMFGLTLVDLSSPLGYYAVLALYLVILVTVYSAMLGVKIIFKEELNCTAEFLMTKPITRKKILISKGFAALTNVVIINLILYLLSLAIISPYSDVNIITEITEVSFGIFLTSITFLSFGLMAASVPKFPIKASISVLALVIISFLLMIISDLFSSLEILKYFSLYKYFDAKEIVTAGLSTFSLIIMVIFAISFIFIAYNKYGERDLDI